MVLQDKPAPRPREVFATGKFANTLVPDGLAWAGALRALIASAPDICIGINASTFYSEQPVELHNFVDSLYYRFFEEDGRLVLAYCVSTHQGGFYAELAADGTRLRGWSDGSPIPQTPGEKRRMAVTLGI